MMKLRCRLALPSILLAVTSAVFASDGGTNNSQSTGQSTGQGDPFSNSNSFSDLTTYLLNLGQYMGYNLQVSPSTPGADPSSATQISSTLLNMSATQLVQSYMFNNFLGALLVNTAAQSSTPIVSDTVNYASMLNPFANFTFSGSNISAYNNASPQQVSVSSLIDQQTYQADPVSQAILNILGTPDYTYCMNNDATQWDPAKPASCQYLYQNRVKMNVIGTIPSTNDFFSYTVNQPLLAQLNSNSLLTPLMYAVNNTQTPSTSSPIASTSGSNQGLIAPTQAQQAANFIRYAISSVAPFNLPDRKSYDAYYGKAMNTDNTIPLVQQMQAQATLTSYLTTVRVYAAQSSVAMSNLYSMFSRRLPQNLTGANTTGQQNSQTSQALSEFTMATWRLYNPDQSANTQWINQINNASPATVQKEMATLLAEINYQLYLSRQQQERILLTNTMILMQDLHNTQQTITLDSAAGNTSVNQ